MEAYNKNISGVFSNGGAIHYVLPHFQREYTWEEEQWRQLVDDLMSVYDDLGYENKLEHFLGSVVVVDDGMKNGTVPVLKLVDGQQRLVSISLLLCVLRDLTKSHPSNIAQQINAMLVNTHQVGDVYFKVFPSTKYNDREVYTTIINGGDISAMENSRIVEAYKYILKELNTKISNKENLVDAEKLYQVLVNCFQVVFISLNSQSESPYKIFESLNAKGKPLSQGDKVRNYIAMTLPSAEQEDTFNRYWAKIEDLLHEQNSIGQVGELTAFIRHYLAVWTGTLYSEENVYPRFRIHMERVCSTTDAFIKEIIKLTRFAGYYDKLLRPDNEVNNDISKMLKRLNVLEISTAYPLFLAAYEATHSGRITTEDFIYLLKSVENIIVRRYICAERTNHLNKWFPILWKEIDKEQEKLGFNKACRQALSSKYYPSDRQVLQAVQEVKIYSRAPQYRLKLGLILETIEYYLWADADVIPQLKGPSTIEHILPQSLPTAAWKNELGKNWQQIHEDYAHTLGNLTLVTQSKNNQLSNADFAKKQKILISQGSRLNSYFSTNIVHWNEEAIHTRAQWLGEKILEIWSPLTEIETIRRAYSYAKTAI